MHISKKWGFTKFNEDEFENMVAEKPLIAVGCGVKYIPNRGSLDKWQALYSWDDQLRPLIDHAHWQVLLLVKKKKKKSMFNYSINWKNQSNI